MGISLRRLAGRRHLCRRGRKNHVNIHADQLGRVFRHLLDPIRPAELNDNGLALDVAEVTQACPQSFY